MLLRFHFHDVLEQLKTNIQTNFHTEWFLGLAIDYAWISKLLRDVTFTWRARELLCWFKRWLISGNSAIWKVLVLEWSIIVTFFSSPRDNFTPLYQNSVTDVSAGFRPPCWCPSRWAPAWRLHINLYKFGENVSPHIFRKKNCCDLNLGESLCISAFFPFPDSRVNLLNGFYFLFWSILNGVTLKTSNAY